jgi:hypothetical protein
MRSTRRKSSQVLRCASTNNLSDYHKLTYYYYAETYVNFNELVTDLFKQYKVRIWMSAINPASVINPADRMNVQPPSAVGPGAIMHRHAGQPSYSVGGFGNNNYRGNNQYGEFFLFVFTP